MEAKTFFLMSGMVISGTLSTICLSLQFSEKSKNVSYSHPWFQTQNMFLGEFYCLIFYYLMNYISNKANSNSNSKDDSNITEIDNEERSPSVFLLAIPTTCDFFASTLLAFALLNMTTSVYQMFRGGLVLVTALLSVIFLGRKQYRHHLLGLFTVFLSIFIIGYASMLKDKHKKENTRETNLLGFFMMGLSLLFTGTQFIIEELFLGKYKTNPLKVVGLEGMWGIIIYAVVLLFLQNIRCDHFSGRADICTINSKDEWRVEDTIFAIQQIFSNKFLMFLVVTATFIIALYNFFGVSVTKYASAAQRAVVDNLRTILVWMFFLIAPTSIKESFSFLQLLGFMGLVFGTLVYNEVVEISYMDMDKYTKRNLLAQEADKETEILKKSKDYSHYSTINPEQDDLEQGVYKS